MQNRMKDVEIHVEGLSNRLQGIRYATELKYDELAEKILSSKRKVVDLLEQKNSAAVEEVKKVSSDFEEKALFLQAVLSQIEQIKNNNEAEDENSDLELYGFYFANQERIRSYLNEENELEAVSHLKKQCQLSENRIKQWVDSEISKTCSEIHESLEEIFQVPKQSKLASNLEYFRSTVMRTQPNQSTHEVERLTSSNSKPFKGTHSPKLHSPSGKLEEKSFLEKRTRSRPQNAADLKDLSQPLFGNTPAFAQPKMTSDAFYRDVLGVGANRLPGFYSTKSAYNAAASKVGSAFGELERKLAQFDIRTPKRHRDTGNKSSKRNDSVFDASLRIDQELQDRTHNTNRRGTDVDSLRIFRQRIRNKLSRDLPKPKNFFVI